MNSLLPIIFHTGRACFQSSSNSRQCLDPQMSISQSAWGSARGIELPKGPQTTWHQPRLCSTVIPSYVDIPSSGPWDGFPWSRENICLPSCPTFSCFLGCFQLPDYPLSYSQIPPSAWGGGRVCYGNGIFITGWKSPALLGELGSGAGVWCSQDPHGLGQ